MPLATGARIGTYEIVSAIGAGGMGEVYRARDTKLHRDVAIKVLPEMLARDPERLARFEREAQLLAALNHPNIAQIYGLERHDRDGPAASPVIVMELVEGETLDARLQARAPADAGLPIDDALRIARQIADALDAAHEQGIIHRDLKPANVKVRDDGTVKVLDFGLAKALDPIGAETVIGAAATATQSPTLTSPAATIAGTILGTAAYMSPEQARGKAVDKRTDIWAFGCVLFEMLTGRLAFAGDDVADFVVAVMTKEPDWTLLPHTTPARVIELARRCLKKDPRERLRDIGDARIDLDAVYHTAQSAGGSDASRSNPTARRLIASPALAVAAAVIALTTGLMVGRLGFSPSSSSAAFRFTLLPPAGFNLYAMSMTASFAVSPDGRRIAFLVERNSKSALAFRDLDSFDATVIPETDGALAPFWSPDARYIGFFSDRQLKKVAVTGGRPALICDFNPLGASQREPTATWGASNIIVFAMSGALLKVPAEGGAPQPATSLAGTEAATMHVYPQFLPDGRHFLFGAVKVDSAEGVLYRGSIDNDSIDRITDAASRAEYAEPGFLFLLRRGTLVAQPFEWKSGQLTGTAVPIATGVASSIRLRASFSVSGTGLLIYRGTEPVSRLLWVDRQGQPIGFVGEPGDYTNPALSPDARTIALERHQPNATGALDGNIWTVDIARGLFDKITFNSPMHSSNPIWSHDGKRLAYRRETDLVVQDATATSEGHVIVTGASIGPSAWSPDDRLVVYEQADPNTLMDIWVAPVSGGGPRVPFARSRFNEGEGRFSPDGRWMAYTSDESGGQEVYVRRYPVDKDKWRVSPAGGRGPRWQRDGEELFYSSLDGKLVAVPVKSNGRLEIGAPTTLFDLNVRVTNNRVDYDVASDGQRFLLNQLVSGTAALNVISNWRSLVEH